MVLNNLRIDKFIHLAIQSFILKNSKLLNAF